MAGGVAFDLRPTVCYKESKPITRLPDGPMPDEVSMPTQQFIPTVQKHLDAADRHFDAGDMLLCSAELWQAGLRALQTVADARGWECQTEKDFYAVVNRLAAKTDDPFVLQAGLGAPELFRANAEYDFLDEVEIAYYRKLVPGFIGNLFDAADFDSRSAACYQESGPITRLPDSPMPDAVSMPTQQFIPTVQKHLDAADRHFAAGEMLQCSAELWQAGLRALQMVAEARGWACQTERDWNAIVNRLAVKLDDPFVLQAGLGAPLIFKDNAVYDFLDDVEIAFFRKSVPGFIDNLFEVADFKA